MAPQSEVHSPLNFKRPIGSVLKSSEVNIINANKNSFQIQTVWNIAALAITGPDKGTIILKNIWSFVHPSIVAASSTSFGKSKKKA